MWPVARVLLVLAATATFPPDSAPPSPSDQYPNVEALRHYAQGVLLEEGGEGPEAMAEYFRALLLDPRSAAIARRASELSARLGDPQRALEFADRALKLEPGDTRGLWLKGTALFNLGRGEEALEALIAAARADSDQAGYVQSLARVAEQLDRLDLVAWAYGRLVALDDADGEAWFQLAAARGRLGDFEAAERAIERVLQLSPQRPGAYFLQGWIQEGLGNADRAIDLYRRHLKIHSTDLVTRRRLVNLLSRQKRFAEAHAEAQLVSRERPDDVEASLVEADLALRAGRTRDGLRLLERIPRRAPADPDLMLRVLGVLVSNGRAREAVARAEGWARQHPGDFHGPLLTARALAASGKRDLAMTRAREAVETAPDSLAPRQLLGQLYQSAKRYAEAESVWTETVRRFPEVPGIAFDLAFCREQLGDLGGAEAAVRDVLAREPDNARALNFLGYLLADHALKLQEALDLIQRAVRLDADNGAYVDSLGWVFYRLGRFEEARAELERAVLLTEGDPVVHEHLGDVYKELKLMDLAREQYSKSLARDTTNSRVRVKLSEGR